MMAQASTNEADWAFTPSGMGVQHGMQQRKQFQKILVSKAPSTKGFANVCKANPDLKKTRPLLNPAEEEKREEAIGTEEQMLLVGIFHEDAVAKSPNRYKVVSATNNKPVDACLDGFLRVACRIRADRNTEVYVLINPDSKGLCEPYKISVDQVFFFSEYREGVQESNVEARKKAWISKIKEHLDQVSDKLPESDSREPHPAENLLRKFADIELPFEQDDAEKLVEITKDAWPKVSMDTKTVLDIRKTLDWCRLKVEYQFLRNFLILSSREVKRNEEQWRTAPFYKGNLVKDIYELSMQLAPEPLPSFWDYQPVV